jgi:hypothetical protein
MTGCIASTPPAMLRLMEALFNPANPPPEHTMMHQRPAAA